LTATNAIRKDPASFVPKLEAMLPKFNGNLYDSILMTNEGAVAVQEAIDFLNNATPITEDMTWD